MDREIVDEKGRSIHIEASSPQAQKILKAFASNPRLQMLKLLGEKLYNISEIAEKLGIPLSTANRDISILQEAGLLRTELTPATRGLQKVCQRIYDTVIISLPKEEHSEYKKSVDIHMPVGAYVDFDVQPTCGLVSEERAIGLFDIPTSFYEPDHSTAQLLWFHSGYVEYAFPNRLPPAVKIQSLQISLELCSEAPLHDNNWPSDITMWINNVEIGSWTSPGDFGGKRGIYTPNWWRIQNTQYGLLKVWQVNHDGSFIDGLKTSEKVLSDLNIEKQNFISVRIGVKKDAYNVGGINIFGKMFGNYSQDIILHIDYEEIEK